jgi:hypothetical protein
MMKSYPDRTIETPFDRKTQHVFHQYTLKVNGKDREGFKNHLTTWRAHHGLLSRAVAFAKACIRMFGEVLPICERLLRR